MPQKLLDRLEAVGQLLPQSNSRVLIVADATAYQQSGARDHLDGLLAGHDVQVYSDFGPNPSFADAHPAAEFLAKDPLRVVIALGGGAAIDTAKIACFAASNLEDCRRHPDQAIAGADSLNPRQNSLIAVPTTAGTGSEATHFAVAYIGVNKYSLAHETLMPDATVLDPTLTHSLPPSISASTGLDALSQAIESLWSIHSTNVSEPIAERAMRMALGNLEKAVHTPCPNCRKAMLQAANLAGQAINLTRTTAPHALSYHLTIRYGVPHGFAVAMNVGALLRFNAEVCRDDVADPRGVQHIQARLSKIAAALGGSGDLRQAAEEAHRRWTELLLRIGAPVTLAEVGLTNRSQREAFVQSVNAERLANNPRQLGSDELRSLVEEFL